MVGFSASNAVSVDAVKIDSFATTLLDRLLLLSPRTWLGILEIQDKNATSPFSLSVIQENVAGLVVPFLLFWILHILLTSTKISIVESSKFSLQPSRCLWMTMLSPWILQCWYEFWRQLSAIWPAIHNYRVGRAVALESATNTFRERLSEGRAYRTRRYDVYLPPPTTTKNAVPQQALLFLPGALIPHVAYAESASRLSDAGFLVAVVSMEPSRLAYHHLGADQQSLKRIMRQVQKQQAQKLQWTIMGHSMGSFAAARLFDKLLRHGHCRPSGDVVIRNKLVLWGVAAFVGFISDLSDHGATDVLVIQGTKDELREMLKDGNEKLETSFPPRTRIEYIKGGTHDGFGSYGSPAVVTGSSDRVRSKQQEQACKMTIEFFAQ